MELHTIDEKASSNDYYTSCVIEPDFQIMMDREMDINLTVTKLLYFVIYNDKPLS